MDISLKDEINKMNFDDINSLSWDLVSIIGKGGSSTVYKASVYQGGPKSSSAAVRSTSFILPDNEDVSFISADFLSQQLTQQESDQQQLEKQYLAVKEIDLDALNRNQIDAIQAEITTMKDLNHSNIVKYYGMQQKLNRIYIFMEYASSGSLRQFYQKCGKLTEFETVYCLKQILKGLQYLHHYGFAHRDIKCANCLLFNNGSVKLADFGASKRFESESIVSGLKGTPHWMSPEVN
jgi:serine/threonine protein kinase